MKAEGRVIAIDIGGSTTKLALVDAHGALALWRSLETKGPVARVFLQKVIDAIEELQSEAQQPVLGVSLAIAGFVSPAGVLTYNPNLPWLEDEQIAAVIAEQFDLPVHAETDSNAACIAEYLLGEGRGASRFLCLTGGTGLGVGMIVDGRLMRVAHGGMGDAGHIILSPEGPKCSCGGRGCAEAFLSTGTLGERYAEVSRSDKSFRALVEDALQCEPSAVTLLAEAGHWLGVAAASLASIFFPDRIAVAGGLSHAGDGFFAAAEASFRTYGGEYPLSRASLVRASTGEHATLLGAAGCAFYPELLGRADVVGRR